MSTNHAWPIKSSQHIPFCSAPGALQTDCQANRDIDIDIDTDIKHILLNQITYPTESNNKPLESLNIIYVFFLWKSFTAF